MDFRSHPVFLSPALPTELLQFTLQRCAFPTTLVICSDRAQFLRALLQDVNHKEPQQQDQEQEEEKDDENKPSHDLSNIGAQHTAAEDQDPHGDPEHPIPPPCPPPPPPPPQPRAGAIPPIRRALLNPSISQTAIARHIRTVFVPTVTHLRTFLAVFAARVQDPSSSRVSRPPARGGPGGGGGTGEGQGPPPLLLVYGFLALHRHTSEWSVQGLSSSAAGLVEAAAREGFWCVVCEKRRVDDELGLATEAGDEDVLGEGVPVLSAGVNVNIKSGGWSGKTVEVRRVLGRWFRFEEGEWERIEKQ